MKKAVTFISWVEGECVGIRNSRGESVLSSDPKELLDFLRFKGAGALRVVWDLDKFITPVIKKLPVDVIAALVDQQTSYKGIELYYLWERIFRVGKSRYYGIQAFWSAFTQAPKDLQAMHSKSVELLQTLAGMGITEPRKLTSPIAVFEDSEWGESVYSGIPKGYELPESKWDLLEFAEEADMKDWVSNYQVGHFKEGEVFDYDISSCYPYIASLLPDLREMDVWHSKELNERELNAKLGFIKGEMWIDPKHKFAHCSPIMARVGSQLLPSNPVGIMPYTAYSIQEIRYVLNTGIGRFTVDSGWFADGGNGGRPFHDIMLQLYRMRSKSDLAKGISKGIANSLIGKLIETRRTATGSEQGKMVNEAYHATITSVARLMVSRFLMGNKIKKNELVCVQTDGCKVTRDIEYTDRGIGKWISKGSESTIVVSPYKVYAGSARPYQMTYNDIMLMAEEEPSLSRYPDEVDHVMTLKEAINIFDDPSLVGQTVSQHNSLDLIGLDLQQNRVFNELPVTGEELISGKKYHSDPFELE